MSRLWVTATPQDWGREISRWVRADQIVEVRTERSTSSYGKVDVIADIAVVDGRWDSLGGEPGGAIGPGHYQLHQADSHEEANTLATHVVASLARHFDETGVLRIAKGQVQLLPLKQQDDGRPG